MYAQVDLGLPSGLLWAETNLDIGRNVIRIPDSEKSEMDLAWEDAWGMGIEEWEYLFSGEKAGVNGTFLDWGDGHTVAPFDCLPDLCTTYRKSVETLKAEGVVDSRGRLTRSYDVVSRCLGGKWRLPTREDWLELIRECRWEYRSTDKFRGYVVYGPNGNSISLPMAGYYYGGKIKGEYGNYWSSTVSENDKTAYSCELGPEGPKMYQNLRYFGFSVRGVTER